MGLFHVFQTIQMVLNRITSITNELLIHFEPLFSFCTPWKHHNISGFLMFSGGIERDLWHEMVKKNWTETFNSNKIRSILQILPWLPYHVLKEKWLPHGFPNFHFNFLVCMYEMLKRKQNSSDYHVKFHQIRFSHLK